jgi:hypothetical protein
MSATKNFAMLCNQNNLSADQGHRIVDRYYAAFRLQYRRECEAAAAIEILSMHLAKRTTDQILQRMLIEDEWDNAVGFSTAGFHCASTWGYGQ